MLNSKRGDIVSGCPRCGEHSIMYPLEMNALSRTTRGPDDVSVYVCSPCGSDEGMMEHFSGGCQPQHGWPIAERQYGFEFDSKSWEAKV